MFRFDLVRLEDLIGDEDIQKLLLLACNGHDLSEEFVDVFLVQRFRPDLLFSDQLSD